MVLLHQDLLRQAKFLVNKERKRPQQASLRRSISASYYALFHLLIHESTKLMLSGKSRNDLRFILGRAFDHKKMRKIAEDLQNDSYFKGNYKPRNPPMKLKPAFQGEFVVKELAYVAFVFVQLQESRHQADYNLSTLLTRNEARKQFELGKRCRTSLTRSLAFEKA